MVLISTYFNNHVTRHVQTRHAFCIMNSAWQLHKWNNVWKATEKVISYIALPDLFDKNEFKFVNYKMYLIFMKM